jgi:excinuclease UvrABC helicase subunit UvrB
MVGTEADRGRQAARSATSASAHDVRLEMMKEMGFCRGSRKLFAPSYGQETGEPPPTLLDYCRGTRWW